MWVKMAQQNQTREKIRKENGNGRTIIADSSVRCCQHNFFFKSIDKDLNDTLIFPSRENVVFWDSCGLPVEADNVYKIRIDIVVLKHGLYVYFRTCIQLCTSSTLDGEQKGGRGYFWWIVVFIKTSLFKIDVQMSPSEDIGPAYWGSWVSVSDDYDF